jgi:hypothetical protein
MPHRPQLLAPVLALVPLIGCFTKEPDDSCMFAFDDVCDEPLVCDEGTDCTDCGDCSGSTDSSSGSSGGSCVDAGDPCSGTVDCCDGYCISETGVCHDSCSSDSDCYSGCCAPLEGGGGACADPSYCG